MVGVHPYLVVGMCSFEDVIELQVGWKMVKVPKCRGFADGCRPCAVCWPACLRDTQHKHDLVLYRLHERLRSDKSDSNQIQVAVATTSEWRCRPA